MLKKLALGTAVICVTPFLFPDFRRGFKHGWNANIDEAVARGEDIGPFRKFKNV